MSLNRFVYYNAVVAGWAALLAWLVLERPLRYMDSLGDTGRSMFLWDIAAATLTAGIVGATIGVGLSLVSGATNPQWKRRPRRILPGLLGGGTGGLLGGLAGALMFSYFELPRALGWSVMGLAIGAAEGIHERSARKTRNGLIGGAVGGLLGGWLFDLIARPDADMSGRAAAFVILGISIGALIGLTHVVLREAWLTVLDGFQPGRQLILTRTVTVLGRGDHLPLPFLGYAGRNLESEHLRIIRQPDGQYVVEDNGSRIGTSVNGQPIQGTVSLNDGDLIKLGTNIVRFERRQRVSDRAKVAAAPATGAKTAGIAPPPPPPDTSGAPPVPGGPTPGPVRPSSAGPPPPPSRRRPSDKGPRIPPPPPPPG